MHCRHGFPCLAQAVVFGAIVLAAIPACFAGEVVDQIDKTFPVKERPTIYVRNSDGRTTLRATGSSEVRIHAVKEVVRAANAEEARQMASRVEIRIEQVGNRIEVEARYPKMSGFWNHGEVLVHFEVSGPAASDLDAHSSDGALDADGFNGNLQLSTSDGRLTATNCSGRIAAHVSDGQMKIISAQGELDARTSDGTATIDGTFKGLDVKSSDGSLDITVRPGSVMERPWSVTSSDGSIQMRLPEGFSADMDVSTSDGNIRVDHPVTMTGNITSKHHLVGKLNNGGSLLRIHASDGSVHVLK